MDSVKPVGGIGKKEAILDIIEKNEYEAANLMYTGDSITDCEALEYAKDNQGISISFNGNIHSISSAAISVTATNNLILAVIAEIFKNKSTEGVYDFIAHYEENPLDAVIDNTKDKNIAQEILLNKASIDIITEENVEKLNIQSKKIRNQVRGKNIGNLG